MFVVIGELIYSAINKFFLYITKATMHHMPVAHVAIAVLYQ